MCVRTKSDRRRLVLMGLKTESLSVITPRLSSANHLVSHNTLVSPPVCQHRKLEIDQFIGPLINQEDSWLMRPKEQQHTNSHLKKSPIGRPAEGVTCEILDSL